MTTLSKRATPLQSQVMRVIEGAVRDAAQAHPGQDTASLAASIAKRATGTLTALLPDVLAVEGQSNSRAVSLRQAVGDGGSGNCQTDRRGGASYSHGRIPTSLEKAAPLLLSELEDAVAFMKERMAQDGDHGVSILIRHAEAAIKLATGE